ncbi:MAG: polyprenyl synthetase family protein [Alphaproteobacteria bacterium]|nr:polyprenyl synthetase family protein [Alphaproteobacteria bacterium]
MSHLLHDDMKKVNDLILNRMESDVAMIPKLAGYLIASGGKRIRPLMTLAATRLYDGQTTRPFALAAAVEFIHTATLLHDDVVDESAERRGHPSANVVYGNQASVLVGDFLFSRAFQLMVEDGSLEVLRILSAASAVIAEGEVLQLSLANDISLTLPQYEKIIACKTAALFAAATEIGPIIAGQDPAISAMLREYGFNLGMAFQIADDVLDYTADQDKLGKTVGDDFREGKLTAPVIYALQVADEGEQAFWQRTMEDRIQREEDLPRALEILKKHKSFAKGMDLARSYARQAQDQLKNAPKGDLRDLLIELASFTVDRTY